jgi:hypothetical protein
VAQQQLNARIGLLESKLASIQLDVPGIEHFDIRRLFMGDNESASIDPALTYFVDDQFYATSSDSFWTYSKTTEAELLKWITDSSLPGPIEAVARKYPIHLWRADDVIEVVDAEETLHWFSHIALQRLELSSIGEIIGVGASFARWTEEKGDYEFDDEDLATDDVDEFLARATAAFDSDAAGVFFLFQMLANFVPSIQDQNKTFRLRKIQKLGPVLYAKSVTDHRNVMVDGVAATLYIQQDWLVVSTSTHLYLIKVVLPSIEPTVRAPVSASVYEWLTSVKFVVN